MKTSSISASKRPVRRTKNIWIASSIILLLLVFVYAYATTGFPLMLFQAQATTSGPEYHTAVVQRGDITIAASGTGTLVAAQSVDLSFSSKGIVAQVNVKPGDPVTVGEVLAKLRDTASLEAAVANDQYNLLQAQQALSDQQQNANVALAKALQAQVDAQQKYNDQLTADQRTAYARCSKEVNTKNKAALDLATTKLQEVSQRYYGSDAWITAKNNYDQALANYNYCIAYTPDEKTSANASLQVAQVNLQQAQATYKTLSANKGTDPATLALNEARVKQAETQLAQDQQALQGAALIAPITGTVTYVAAEQGATVGTSKFITISDLSRPQVQVSIDETDLSKLALGSSAQVTFDALPDQTFTGKVIQVNPQLTASGQYNVATGVIQLDADAAKALEKLPLGLTASVTIIDQQSKNTLMVPISAVRDLANQQNGIFVMASNGKLQLRIVKVGLKDSTHAEILSGLKEGETISTGATQAK